MMLTLVDVPLVAPETICLVAARYRETHAPGSTSGLRR